MKEPIELEDWLVVSDEEPGIFDPGSGKSYRLFTHAHVNNTLVVNGKKSKTRKLLLECRQLIVSCS